MEKPEMQDTSTSELFSWAETLFPLHRSLTGEGNRETLRFLQRKFPLLKVQEVRSGTIVEDWRVPQEWEVSKAFIEDSEGNVLVDYKQNNLHLVAYSTSVDGWFTWEELRPHLPTQTQSQYRR
jgi:aminopeptidase-like protein